MRERFATTDECKPIRGGDQVLISSSSGGCALLERPSGRVLWHALLPNAHSLELLPHDRVIVAQSLGAAGNRLVLFDLSRSGQIVWETPLPSAHGVVWDEEGRCLWALGFEELRCYELKDWDTGKPSLILKAAQPLPDTDGHDLQAVPGTRDLCVSTGRQVFLFDRDKNEFRLHPQLGGRANVKSISIHPGNGRTAFLQADGDHWWSATLRFLSPEGEVPFTRERLYKARWLPAQ